MAEEPLDGQDLAQRQEGEGLGLPAAAIANAAADCQGEEVVEILETHGHREEHKHAGQ